MINSSECRFYKVFFSVAAVSSATFSLLYQPSPASSSSSLPFSHLSLLPLPTTMAATTTTSALTPRYWTNIVFLTCFYMCVFIIFWCLIRAFGVRKGKHRYNRGSDECQERECFSSTGECPDDLFMFFFICYDLIALLILLHLHFVFKFLWVF